MTERLYYSDSIITEATAQVLETRKTERGYEVRLDKTVFFPESGGQLADKGVIEGCAVKHVLEENGEIWHVLDRNFEEGETVKLELDNAARLDHSQQHTGEHILSGLAHSLFGALNVGFHMADTYSTIDLDVYLEKEQLFELERAANRAIQSNVKTTYQYVTPEELEKIELRKKANGLIGEIRIVYAGGVDSCTCCGTHCQVSGDVGAIHINASMKYKGGIRIWFLCGMRAIDNMLEYQDTIDKLAKRFSAKPESIFDCVVKQGEELNKAKHELKEKTAKLMEYRAADILANTVDVKGKKVAVVLEHGLCMQDLKLLAENLCKEERTVAVLASVNEDVISYVLRRGTKVDLDMRYVCSTLNVMLDGKGGGRVDSAQGSAKSRADNDIAFEQFKTYIVNMLRG